MSTQTREIMTENEALAVLRRNKITIQYPKLIIEKEDTPGLKCWAAIDCLTNRIKPKYILIDKREVKNTHQYLRP